MSPRAAASASDWVTKLLAGDRLALARVITKLENRDADASALVKGLYAHTGKAQTLGITGPPGAGKSTLVNQLALSLRKSGKKVAIVCVDPSSPFTGGALLGDRIRMQGLQGDPGVYIRSLGTRGKQGGLSHASQEVLLALDAAGFDVILLETAGVGQTELDVLRVAQSVLVVLVPESGDGIQVLKAGLMEIADLFVVNKCDRPEAERLVNELETLPSLTLSKAAPDAWKTPILRTQAVSGVGISEVLKAFEAHQAHLTQSGLRLKKSDAFLQNEVLSILVERLHQSVADAFLTSSGQDLLRELRSRSTDPYSAADILSGLS